MTPTIPKILIASEKKASGENLRKKLQNVLATKKVVSLSAIPATLETEAPDCLLLLVEEIQKLKPALLERIKQCDDNLPMIVLSTSKELGEVLPLMRNGIYDYISLPPDLSRLELSVQNACRMYQLTKRIFLLENQIEGETKCGQILGHSAGMQTVFQTIKNVSKTNATVLILGESGTGKELVAKAIHQLSKRNIRRFIDINCGAIPRELLENELFGHEKGGFTGADRRYLGCCERADGGTLFLDEISEMDLSLQVKLLRFLQERQFLRIGGNESIKVDVGIIAATNKDLAKCVEKGTFREDLFYRLNVVAIPVPPLRERREDIPLLASHFLEKYSHKNGKVFLSFTQEAMEALIEYDWPGNVRELENTIERGVALYNDTKIKLKYLPEPFQKFKRSLSMPKVRGEEIKAILPKKVLPLTLIERYAIEQALKACTGNVSLAASRLQIGQATLYRKIKQYGIRV